MQTIFLTDATGYIGGSIASRLFAGGTRVRSLVRTPENATRLAQRDVDPVLGSLDDAALLIGEAGAADGVINTASADPREPVRALIAGLRVADVSIMPMIPSANLNASVLMIGEKAADLIAAAA